MISSDNDIKCVDSNIIIIVIIIIMKLLSIDVGIKNLAYCLLNIDDNKTWNISHWGIINLCPNSYECMCINNNNICNKLARYSINNIYFCSYHAKKSTYIINNMDFKLINKKSVEELIYIAKKYNINCPILKKTKLVNEIKIFMKDKILSTVNKVSANEINLIDIGIAIKNKFDAHFEMNEMDHIVIENQISPIANRMKCIQGMIAQYFIMKNINKIYFISASNKLKSFIGDNKTSYSDRKKMSIDITRELINKNELCINWVDIFSNHKKKDDLADSLLQAISYSKKLDLL